MPRRQDGGFDPLRSPHGIPTPKARPMSAGGKSEGPSNPFLFRISMRKFRPTNRSVNMSLWGNKKGPDWASAFHEDEN